MEYPFPTSLGVVNGGGGCSSHELKYNPQQAPATRWCRWGGVHYTEGQTLVLELSTHTLSCVVKVSTPLARVCSSTSPLALSHSTWTAVNRARIGRQSGPRWASGHSQPASQPAGTERGWGVGRSRRWWWGCLNDIWDLINLHNLFPLWTVKQDHHRERQRK